MGRTRACFPEAGKQSLDDDDDGDSSSVVIVVVVAIVNVRNSLS